MPNRGATTGSHAEQRSCNLKVPSPSGQPQEASPADREPGRAGMGKASSLRASLTSEATNHLSTPFFLLEQGPFSLPSILILSQQPAKEGGNTSQLTLAHSSAPPSLLPQ